MPALAEAAEPQSPTQPPSGAQNQAHPAAPGQFEVDEEAAERALERTLVVQGALLLPFGLAEIQPSFSYTRSELDDQNLALQQGTPFLVEQDIRRNTFIGDLFFRFGLPFDSQLEFGIPYQYFDSKVVTDFSGGGVGRNEVSDSSSGFGDFRVGLAKGLLREGLWWPNLIGRVTWNTDTGKTNAANPLGNGFNELSGSLTATKRQDPLVFIGSFTYTTSFEKNGIDPGDAFNFSVGALLAASPETSLRLTINQSFVDKIKVDGRAFDGSDRVIASLAFGASSIVGHGKFLDLAATAGLTDQAPDYSVTLTLVVRFGLPSFSF
ncbi:transporter [Nitrococcus mobilis]|uniref:transporter n=1 Tax=Nitrococcus mobilis TaxID=35797 RepID=UPI0012EAF736|nr:transporter [Nitrococcus mobilis]